jgi:hypothetical protein
MKNLLFRILIVQNRKRSMVLSGLGLLFGFFILLSAFALYSLVKNSLEHDKQIFGSDFIVINKKVSMLNTLSVAKSEFTPEELNDLKQQEFISSVAPFVSNAFKIGAYTEASANMPGFYTELFFQAVPDKYLNIDDKRWKWSDDQREIPIIFPGDYLKLYNFGFATSQGLPQLSASTISKVSIKVKISSPKGDEIYLARIIGITDRINSILVPMDFIEWANEEYGVEEKMQKPSMILLETPNASDPKLYSYIEEQNYETNTEKLKNSKATFALKVAFYIMVFIGGVITFLSLLMFLLSMEILILRSKDDLKRLFYIGYSFKSIMKVYTILLLALLFSINVLTLAGIHISVSQLVSYLGENGFAVGEGSFYSMYIFAILLSVLFFIINVISIKGQLKRINA